ncbi:MAG: ADOP family duplicated permease [Gemmatimonadaceae bacterium]
MPDETESSTPAWRRYLRFWGRDVRADVDEELQFHMEALEAEYRAAGLDPAAARAAARGRFGDYDRVAAACREIDQLMERDVKRADWWDALRQDVGFAFRSMRRTPGFTAVVLLTLMLGIGATTAIFTVVKGVLLEPLPYARPEQIVRVWQANTKTDQKKGTLSQNDVEDWLASDAVKRTVSALGFYWYNEGGTGVDLTGRGDPARLDAAAVSPGFFPALGVQARLGRTLRPEENVAGNDRVVVLSEGAWRRRFGADPRVIGQAVTINGLPQTIVGVMPASFAFPSPRVEVWRPLTQLTEDMSPRVRPNRFLDVVARLAPGATADQARAAINGVARRLAEEHPETNAQFGAVTLESLQDAIVGSDVRAGLLVLLGAVAFVLLIACANISGLLLSRAAARERELAVRAALGAARARLLRQLVTESVVLALAGGLLGVLVAALGVRALAAASAGELPRLADVRMDTGVLLFAFGAALASGLLFGLWPALRLSSGALAPVLRSGGRGVAGGQRARGLLVVVEVALAVMLVVGAGLMVRSLDRLAGIDPGFNANHVVAVSLTFPNARLEKFEEIAPYYAGLLERVQSVPGVVSVGGVKDLPFRGKGEAWAVHAPEHPVAKGSEVQANVLHIAGDYFQAMGTPLLRGRTFGPQDRDTSAAFGVVINQTLARKLWPGEEAVGKSVQVGERAKLPVFGVVADIRQAGLTAEPEPVMYVNALRNPRVRVSFVIRTAGDPTHVVNAVRRAIWSYEPTQTITSVTTLDDLLGETTARPRVITMLLTLFGALGLLVGALGLYGLLAFMVNGRRQEIGVRIALGARPANVFRYVVGQGASLAALGIVAGLAGALALGRVMEGVLYQVSARDPLTYIVVAAILGAVAILASAVPAMRAVRVDPAIALRAE